MLAPTAKALGTAVEALNGAVDGFKCYDARVARAATGAVPFPVFTPAAVSVADQFGTRVFKVTKLRRFCAPADVDGTNPSAPTHARYLVCYQVRVAATKPKQPKFVPTDVSTHPSVRSRGPRREQASDELCLPSFRIRASADPDPDRDAWRPGGGRRARHPHQPEDAYVSPGGNVDLHGDRRPRGRRHRGLHPEGDLDVEQHGRGPRRQPGRRSEPDRRREPRHRHHLGHRSGERRHVDDVGATTRRSTSRARS